jgi:hypothetical protein
VAGESGRRVSAISDAIANLFHAPLVSVTNLALPIRGSVAKLNDHDPTTLAKPLITGEAWQGSKVCNFKVMKKNNTDLHAYLTIYLTADHFWPYQMRRCSLTG